MQYYREGVRRFLHMLVHEPHAILGASLLCLLWSLPVVTVGVGVAAALHYCACQEQGRACTLRQAMRETRHLRGRALAMGLLDVGLLLGAAASLGMVCSAVPYGARFYSGVLLCLDVSFLLTALFRYPALVRGNLSLGRAIHTAFAVALANPFATFLHWCVVLLLIMACAATGIGLLLVLPGGFCLLTFTAWNSLVQRYTVPPAEGAPAPLPATNSRF